MHPQKTKKKQSMATKATDSSTITKAQTMSSTTEKVIAGQVGTMLEKLNSVKLNTSRDMLLARLDRLNGGHRNTVDSRLLPIFSLSLSLQGRGMKLVSQNHGYQSIDSETVM